MFKLDLEKAEEPDILECEVKWAFGSITIDKGSGGNGLEHLEIHGSHTIEALLGEF